MIGPDRLASEQIQDYLLYLLTDRQLQWTTVHPIAAGLTFFYTQTLRRPDIALALPPAAPPARNLQRP